jgi:hypothetical protein
MAVLFSSFTLANPASATESAKSMLQILGSSIAVSARQDFLDQVAKSSKNSSNLDFHVDPLFSKSLTHEVMVDTQFSSDFWAGVRPIDQKIEVYMAPTSHMKYLMDNMWPTLDANGQYGNWLQVKVARGLRDNGFFGGGAPAFDKNGNPVFMMYAPNNFNQGNGFWGSGTSHEFVHLIQRYIMHGDFAPLYGWVIEGQADYLGANIGTRNSTAAFASYFAQLIQSIGTQSPHPEMLTWSAPQFVQWFKGQEITHAPGVKYSGDIPLESYVFGALAFQYLYGTYGFNAVTNLYQYMAQIALAGCPSAETADYPTCTPARHEAFQKAFGISLDDFYVKLAPFIVNQISWAKSTVKKLPSDLSKIAPLPWAGVAIQAKYVAPSGLGKIEEYGNPMPGEVGVSGNSTTGIDPYPPNVPAPNRTCPNSEGATATLYGGSMTCTQGLWKLNPGQVVGNPNSP